MEYRKIKHLRWYIAGLVFLNTVGNYVDRQTLSVLAPELSKQLHFNSIEYANALQAFLVAYTGFYIVSGIIIDRWGVKIVYGAATAWWSVAAILHAFVRSILALSIFRFLLGAGESFNFIASQKIAAEWYPPEERALLNGLSNAAAVTGAIVSPPVVIWLMQTWSWRVAFVATGSLGLFWLIPWIAIYHAPERHRRLTTEELQVIRGPVSSAPSPSQTGSKLRWIDLLKYRQTWGLLAARTVSDPLWWFYLFWLPKYLTESRGMTMKGMSMVVWIPYLASDIGSIAGGWYSGFLIRRKREVLDARKRALLISALVMPLGIIIAFTASQAVAVGLMCVVLFAHMSWKTNLMTLTIDIFPRAVVGSIAGIVATGSGLGAVVFTGIAGYVIEKHSYTPVFVAMGFMHICAYFIVRWTVPDEGVSQPVT